MEQTNSAMDVRDSISRPHKGFVLWKTIAVAAALSCLGAGALLLFAGVSTTGDPYFRYLPQGQNWGVFACIASIAPVLVAVHCFVYLASKSTGVLRITQVVLCVAIAAMLGLTALGVVAVGEANSTGGSFENVRIALYCVAPPVFAALACAFMFVPLAKLRKRFAA